MTALGFGLSAFVLLAVIQTSLDGNIRRSVPDRAPDFFVLDVPKDRLGEFRELVGELAPGAAVETVPTMRASVLAFGPEGRQTVVAEMEELPDGAWGLRGERGITYSATLPTGIRWWRANGGRQLHRRALVSLDEELATAAGIERGDIITIALLGVERSARVASIRRIDWESLGFNNVFVFSPNAVEDAPHNLAATIQLAEGAPQPAGLLRRLVSTFPFCQRDRGPARC